MVRLDLEPVNLSDSNSYQTAISDSDIKNLSKEKIL